MSPGQSNETLQAVLWDVGGTHGVAAQVVSAGVREVADVRLDLLDCALDGAERRTICSMSFSELFAYSVGRPWELRPLLFETVRLAQTARGLRLTGKGAPFEARMELSFRKERLRVRMRWTYVGAGLLEDAAVGLALDMGRRRDVRVTLPHILYNGNPSVNSDQLIPQFGPEDGALLLCEETRFPIPCANVEWREDGKPRFLSLFSMPGGTLAGGRRPSRTRDMDWSLGCGREAKRLKIVAASGLLALNGRKDMTYGGQNMGVPLAGGYSRLRPNDVVEKEFVVSYGGAEAIGHGFRDIVRSGYDVFRPKVTPILSLDKVVELKARALRNRWHSDAASSGYLCVQPVNVFNRPPYYLYGWTGQCLRLAWCDAELGRRAGDEAAMERCRRAVDFYVEQSMTPSPGLRFNQYSIDEDRWKGMGERGVSSRAFGEAIRNLARIVRLFQEAGRPCPAPWTTALAEAAHFLLGKGSRTRAGLFPRFWTPTGAPVPGPRSAGGLTCAEALVEMFALTGQERLERAAATLLDRYWKVCGDRFDRPFAGATLDADCEDKEAAIPFFIATARLHALTGDPVWGQRAEVAADWLLTFVYVWHTGFEKGTVCRRKRFITTGWPGVSVQNHHLDVFFPAYEMSAFGQRTGARLYRRAGRMVFDAWAHGICRRPGDWDHTTPGEQGEQFFQTNFAMGPTDSCRCRGGYNRWNPSWIIANVLENALRFKWEKPHEPSTPSVANSIG